MMNDYLQRALKVIGASEEDVLDHAPSADGQAYTVIVNPGPKHRIPLAELDKVVLVAETAEPDPLDGLGYRELQAMAKSLDIPANQSADDLKAALINAIDATGDEEE